MRPVTRGNPASYSNDYMAGGPNTKPAVITAAQKWQDAMLRTRRLKQAIEQIKQDTANLATIRADNLRRYAKDGGTDGNYTLKQIKKKRIGLFKIYNDIKATYKSKNQTQLIAAANNLIDNHIQEIKYRKGKIKTFSTKVGSAYPTSRKDLIVNIGQYCSYCEMPLATSLAVEHMLPKAGFPLNSLSWDNFLLACPICNSLKNDKPSRTTGINAAVLAGHNPPAETDIQDAARATYLWPNDALNYANWQTYFKYQMKKVIYDNAGTRTSEVDIPDDVVQAWGFGATQATVIEDSGYAIEVKFVQRLANVPFDYGLVVAGLNGGTVYQTLQDAIGQLDGKFQLDFNNQVTVTPLQLNVWQLEEVQTYQINTLDALKPILLSSNGNNLNTFQLTQKESRAFLSNLVRGSLPNQVKGFLAGTPYYVDPVNQQVTVSSISRTIFNIDVTKKLEIIDDNGYINIYSIQQYWVEAHLVTTVSGAQVQAAKVIDDTGLNRTIPADNKASDRRMVKRTRTWFIALDAVRSLNAIVGTAQFNPPGDDLWQLIIQTAVATGYWSIWWSVFNTFISQTYRGAFTNFLLDQANFPGTR